MIVVNLKQQKESDIFYSVQNIEQRIDHFSFIVTDVAYMEIALEVWSELVPSRLSRQTHL